MKKSSSTFLLMASILGLDIFYKHPSYSILDKPSKPETDAFYIERAKQRRARREAKRNKS